MSGSESPKRHPETRFFGRFELMSIRPSSNEGSIDQDQDSAEAAAVAGEGDDRFDMEEPPNYQYQTTQSLDDLEARLIDVFRLQREEELANLRFNRLTANMLRNQTTASFTGSMVSAGGGTAASIANLNASVNLYDNEPPPNHALSPGTTAIAHHLGGNNNNGSSGGCGGNATTGVGGATLAVGAPVANAMMTSPNAAVNAGIMLTSFQQQVAPQQQILQQHAVARTHAFVSDLDRDWMLQEISWEDLKIIEKIGSGAFGDVFLARLWGQEVAVKKLLSRNLFTLPSVAAAAGGGGHAGPQNTAAAAATPSPSLIADFMREVSILRNLRHPNILGFMGMCYKLPDTLCIVTELAAGSLADVLAKRAAAGKSALSVRKIVRYAKDIARALNYLHHKHVIHRDLKPSNLLLDKAGSMKIADFGLSHVKRKAAVETGLHGVCGTPIYMAPEVIANKPYGSKADIYSFGIVVAEMLIGRYPYGDLNLSVQDFEKAILAGLRPTLPASTPPLMHQTIELCWHADVHQRPDCTKLLQLIGEVEESLPPPAPVLPAAMRMLPLPTSSLASSAIYGGGGGGGGGGTFPRVGSGLLDPRRQALMQFHAQQQQQQQQQYQQQQQLQQFQPQTNGGTVPVQIQLPMTAGHGLPPIHPPTVAAAAAAVAAAGGSPRAGRGHLAVHIPPPLQVQSSLLGPPVGPIPQPPSPAAAAAAGGIGRTPSSHQLNIYAPPQRQGSFDSLLGGGADQKASPTAIFGVGTPAHPPPHLMQPHQQQQPLPSPPIAHGHHHPPFQFHHARDLSFITSHFMLHDDDDDDEMDSVKEAMLRYIEDQHRFIQEQHVALDEQRAALDRAQVALAREKQERMELEETKSRWLRELDAKNLEISSLANERSRLQEEVATKEQQLSAKRTEAEHLRAQVESLEQKLREFQVMTIPAPVRSETTPPISSTSSNSSPLLTATRPSSRWASPMFSPRSNPLGASILAPTPLVITDSFMSATAGLNTPANRAAFLAASTSFSPGAVQHSRSRSVSILSSSAPGASPAAAANLALTGGGPNTPLASAPVMGMAANGQFFHIVPTTAADGFNVAAAGGNAVAAAAVMRRRSSSLNSRPTPTRTTLRVAQTATHPLSLSARRLSLGAKPPVAIPAASVSTSSASASSDSLSSSSTSNSSSAELKSFPSDINTVAPFELADSASSSAPTTPVADCVSTPIGNPNLPAIPSPTASSSGYAPPRFPPPSVFASSSSSSRPNAASTSTASLPRSSSLALRRSVRLRNRPLSMPPSLSMHAPSYVTVFASAAPLAVSAAPLPDEPVSESDSTSSPSSPDSNSESHALAPYYGPAVPSFSIIPHFYPFQFQPLPYTAFQHPPVALLQSADGSEVGIQSSYVDDFEDDSEMSPQSPLPDEDLGAVSNSAKSSTDEQAVSSNSSQTDTPRSTSASFTYSPIITSAPTSGRGLSARRSSAFPSPLIAPTLLAAAPPAVAAAAADALPALDPNGLPVSQPVSFLSSYSTLARSTSATGPSSSSSNSSSNNNNARSSPSLVPINASMLGYMSNGVFVPLSLHASAAAAAAAAAACVATANVNGGGEYLVSPGSWPAPGADARSRMQRRRAAALAAAAGGGQQSASVVSMSSSGSFGISVPNASGVDVNSSVDTNVAGVFPPPASASPSTSLSSSSTRSSSSHSASYSLSSSLSPISESDHRQHRDNSFSEPSDSSSSPAGSKHSSLTASVDSSACVFSATPSTSSATDLPVSSSSSSSSSTSSSSLSAALVSGLSFFSSFFPTSPTGSGAISAPSTFRSVPPS